jgi:hypothetical protein
MDTHTNIHTHTHTHRLAQFVLSREDPDETFLKSLPTSSGCIEIIYPVSARGWTEWDAGAQSCVPSDASMKNPLKMFPRLPLNSPLLLLLT